PESAGGLPVEVLKTRRLRRYAPGCRLRAGRRSEDRMRRKLVVSLTFVASVLCMLAVSVEAQRGHPARGHGHPQPQRAAPTSAGIAKALGDLHWGMEPSEVHGYFAKQIQERYRLKIAKAPGTLEEDTIRHQMEDELHRLRESYVRFEGTRTGWDSSFLR